MAGLVRGDHDGGERAALEVLRQQADDLGIRIIVIAKVGLLDVARWFRVLRM